MGTLLAKSPRDGREVTLLDHTRDVMNAAESLFGTADGSTRLGDRWLRFFRIPDVPWATFHGTLLAACGLHDWGKANDRMQDVFSRKPGATQAIRHEHFSALLTVQPACWEKWLRGRTDLDREVILSAVLTHHLKASDKESSLHGFASAVNGAKSFRSLHGGGEFGKVVAAVADRIKLSEPLNLSAAPDQWVFEGTGVTVTSERKRIKGILHQFRRELGENLPRRRFLHAVRAALIAADAAGSGLVRTERDILQWIAANVTNRPQFAATDVLDGIVRKRIEDQKAAGRWIDKGDGKGGWNDFQLACDRLPVRSLLLAPCGSGKTLAAWRWIAARLAERPAGHVLFLYPTRATATEGFRDYVSWTPEADAALMHGTSGFDLDGMFDNGDDPRRENKYEADQRLFALGYRPTATFLTPSAAYGLVLNLAGIDSRLREGDAGHDGKTPATLMRPGLPPMRLALGAPGWRSVRGESEPEEVPFEHAFPRVQTVYQQLHNYPVGKGNKVDDPDNPGQTAYQGDIAARRARGNKSNITPVRREFLSDLRAVIGIVADADTLDHIRRGLAGEFPRYGVPFLGDNNLLLDRAELRDTPGPAYWFIPVKEGGTGPQPRTARLTVHIDRADLSRTVSHLYAPSGTASEDVPPAAWTDVLPKPPE